MTAPPTPEPTATPSIPPAAPPEKAVRKTRARTVAGAPAGATPATVAAEIKGRAAVGQPAPAPPPPPPQWTPEGVGPLVCGLHNFVFSVRGYAELEPEEEKKLSETTAYYLNVRWPAGAKWEPEYRMLALLSGIWGPREMALRKRLAEERAQHETDTGSDGARDTTGVEGKA